MELNNIQFKCTIVGNCPWSTVGKKVTDSDFESSLDQLFKLGHSVLLEHRLFYGSSCPDYKILNDYQDVVAYLNQFAKAGDHILVYSFDEMLDSAKCKAQGKCPNNFGEVPDGGAY